ncbi:peptidase S10 [Olsenella sp. An290]|uniref:S10 family peptidase n=1 Tax=Olsenella sp. An290 TaxID=1965625 RepID=UPI000B396A54|nr:peptidase S10 [Olsenella sp. An290]OUO33730.1 peptidase S10 [Olsenella sp. An290]
MADEKNEGAVTAPATQGAVRGTYASVPADRATDVPAPASARLAWTDGERTIDYEATAAHLEVRDDAGVLLGRMFSLSYVAVDGEGRADASRPVTFAYNGGPGSCSVPVNFGGIGPRRVATDGVSHVRADAPVEDNPHTLLVESDVVFLDALGTGWSVLAEDADPKKIFCTDGDADAFARAICAWLTENGRWSSPLYLFGESYGTVRNAVLMRLLAERGVQLTGVVMLSAVFNIAGLLNPGDDLYYLGMMPTFAATAQFFGKAGAGVGEDEWFERALAFAEDELAPALLRGDRLDEARERAVAERMATFVGLPAEHILARHLRVDLLDFRTHLLAAEGRVCGRLDTRFSSDAPSPMQGYDTWIAGEDAADDAVEGPWVRAFRRFCADELGFHGPARYLSNNYEKVNAGWDWSHEEPGLGRVATPNVSLDVAVALRRNPTLKLAILGGRYDAATTWWNVVHDMSCQFLSPALKSRVSWHLYGCGHMSYVDEPTLEAMGRDLHAFYEKR